MSKKPAQKKTPLIIEPLNWAAPESENQEEQRQEDVEKKDSKKGERR